MRMTRHRGRSRSLRRVPNRPAMFVGHCRHWRRLEAHRHASGEHGRRSGQREYRRESGQPLGQERHVPSIRPARATESSAGPPAGVHAGHHNVCRLRRSALPMTDTELNVIAALAMIGLSSSPNAGYNTPAATGTPSTL